MNNTAEKLIQTLAENNNKDIEVGKIAVKRIIGAARVNYILPDICAETCEQVEECIRCILNNEPTSECQALHASGLKSDITWD